MDVVGKRIALILREGIGTAEMRSGFIPAPAFGSGLVLDRAEHAPPDKCLPNRLLRIKPVCDKLRTTLFEAESRAVVDNTVLDDVVGQIGKLPCRVRGCASFVSQRSSALARNYSEVKNLGAVLCTNPRPECRDAVQEFHMRPIHLPLPKGRLPAALAAGEDLAGPSGVLIPRLLLGGRLKTYRSGSGEMPPVSAENLPVNSPNPKVAQSRTSSSSSAISSIKVSIASGRFVNPSPWATAYLT